MGEAMNVFWGMEVKPGKVGAFVPPPEECKLHISQARPPAHRLQVPCGSDCLVQRVAAANCVCAPPSTVPAFMQQLAVQVTPVFVPIE